jgi:hypothetical protein
VGPVKSGDVIQAGLGDVAQMKFSVTSLWIHFSRVTRVVCDDGDPLFSLFFSSGLGIVLA